MRRLRGRLVLPVTIWLGPPRASPGAGDELLVGLTVSSVMFSQGEPAMVAGLVAPLSELAELVSTAGARFAVHLLGAPHRRLAQHFAGELPAPEEMLATTPSSHGPLLDAVGDRILCRTASTKQFGWSLLVEGEVDEVQLAPDGGPKPLAWYRGAFHALGD